MDSQIDIKEIVETIMMGAGVEVYKISESKNKVDKSRNNLISKLHN